MTYSNPSDFASNSVLPDEGASGHPLQNKDICGESKSCIVYRQRIGGILQAVKVLREEYRSNPVYISALHKEYRIGRGLKHDAIPVYRNFTDNEEEVSIVMDYVDGVKLDSFVTTEAGKEYFGSAENAGKFFKSLLDVLNYLHRSGVVYCDLKPSNIMLRHSDMGVMLIDYDKAYCDIFDRTHGGTAGISEPLAEGEKPTAAKDFTAFGGIIRFIAGKVPGFPSRRFGRLLRDADAGHISSRTLEEALHRGLKKKYGLGIVAAVAVVLGVGLSGYYAAAKSHEEVAETQDKQDKTGLTPDAAAVLAEEPAPAAQAAAVSPVAPKTEIVSVVASGSADGGGIDYEALARRYDERMADVSREIDRVKGILASGKYTQEEFSTMQMQVMQAYSERYTSFVEEYRSQNPGLTEYDAMPIMAKMMESSKFQPKFQNFLDMLSEITQKRIDALLKSMSEGNY